MNLRTLPARWIPVACLLGLLFVPSPAAAQDRLCDPAERDASGRDCRDILISHIRQENVRLDVAFWFMEDSWIASEIIARHQAGVPVRILMDTEANTSTPRNATRLAEFNAAGIPMRERIASGILHWKMMLFEGQGIVEFSGANYSSDAWTVAGAPYTNYIDEAIYFTSKPSIVNSFRTRFDDLWTNTVQYRDYANVNGPLVRAYDTFPIDPELNFVPNESHAGRAIPQYDQETAKIDVIMYRITDSRFADAMIAAQRRGVPVRLITEPQQYRDPVRQYHSWNIDRMYKAGITIRDRAHLGLNHQKSVLLYDRATAVFGSSNWSEASSERQEEHNLFTQDPFVFDWFVAQFERKWNNSTGEIETSGFTPLPPDQAASPAPAYDATGIDGTSVTLGWNGGYWAHAYDVYLGTSPNAMTLIAENLPRTRAGAETRTHGLTQALLPGTSYYWRVVSKTAADLRAESPLWKFTTAGTPPATQPHALVTLTRQPYLQQVTSTSAIVVWATREAGNAEVRIANPAGTSSTVAATSTLFTAASTGMASDYHQHVAALTGLTPATTYSYDILVSETDLNAQADTFRTAPSAGSGTVSFVAFGDSGTGSAEQQQIAARLDGESFDFAVHGGDVAYGNSGGTGGATHQTMNDWFFEMYRNWLRRSPMFPSIGNHDSRASNFDGQPYKDMLVLPENGARIDFPDHAERYYSFDYGPVHVVVLDTELAFYGSTARRTAQLEWLDADLAATSQPWKVAVFHRSPYSAGGEHGSDLEVRNAFGPVFDRFGVQLVISAHEHVYERTVPLTAAQPDANGTTYIVTGGGGGPLYPSGSDYWTAFAASVHHYVKGTASECTLRVDAITASGGILDTVTLTRCATDPEPDPGTDPPGGLGAGDILLHAADATTLVGNFVRVNDATAAGGAAVRNPDRGAAKRTVALAQPSDYFELTFTAQPNVPYRLWMRAKADGNVYYNDSVFVQFAGASNYAIGTTSFTEYNLEDCSGCRLSGWGWQDNGWGVGVLGPTITFTTAGPHRLRIQPREDGLTIDQVLLSPQKFLSTAPGALKNDTTIYPRYNGGGTSTPPANAVPAVSMTAPRAGATFTAPANVSMAASATDSDGSIVRVEFYAGSTLIGTDTSAPFAATWSNVPAGTYGLSARAIDNAGGMGTSTVINITVSAPAPSLPAPWTSQDVGAVGVAGSATVSGGVFTVKGEGIDIWNTADEFHYVWQRLSGDVDIVSRVASIEYVHAWVKAGVMIRESLDANSAHALMLVSPGKGNAFQRRIATGGLSTSTTLSTAGSAPGWVKLARRGNVITAYRSTDGTNWIEVAAETFTMAADVYVGIVVSSHVDGRLATATFDNVTVVPVGTNPPTDPEPTPPALPSGWASQDLGAVGRAGSASAASGTFTMSGSGADVWGTADGFHYAWQQASGDFDLVARVASVEWIDQWTKAGVMVRESLTADSAHGFMLVSPGKGLAFQRRRATGGESTHTAGGAGSAPNWVKLERRGSTLTAYRSADGVTWTLVGSDTFTMGPTVYVGLALTSHDNTRLATATFDSVSIVPR